ncbi:MAG: hypothetical protein A4E45_00241 [Methanosaeta sp. PtaB.Bin039]|mgnify:CR=1 FL=1|nr:MAG: hypothetical protein A4E45_00241 [Methanosaeta sp. PtaB.Bin039]OPY47171.1 MAG: hypothetical protein A4E47_00363 [Methanosaeta sp. PtaU1.Bin028]
MAKVLIRTQTAGSLNLIMVGGVQHGPLETSSQEDLPEGRVRDLSDMSFWKCSEYGKLFERYIRTSWSDQ